MFIFFSGNGSIYFEAIEQTGVDGRCALIHSLSKPHKAENYRNLFLSLLCKQFYEGYNGFCKTFCIAKKWGKIAFTLIFNSGDALGMNGLVNVIQIIMNSNNTPSQTNHQPWLIADIPENNHAQKSKFRHY